MSLWVNLLLFLFPHVILCIIPVIHFPQSYSSLKFTKKKKGTLKRKSSGAVVHTCNSSFLEVETGRITVGGQPRLKVHETPPSQTMAGHGHARVPVILATQGSIKRKTVIQAGSGIKGDPISKINSIAGRVA
jgi:hypothetical protein